jgi:hypothetical protein
LGAENTFDQAANRSRWLTLVSSSALLRNCGPRPPNIYERFFYPVLNGYQFFLVCANTNSLGFCIGRIFFQRFLGADAMNEHEIGREVQELGSRLERIEASLRARPGSGGMDGDRGSSRYHESLGGTEKKPVEWKLKKGDPLSPFLSTLMRLPLLPVPKFNDPPQQKSWSALHPSLSFSSSTGPAADPTNSFGSSIRASRLQGGPTRIQASSRRSRPMPRHA